MSRHRVAWIFVAQVMMIMAAAPVAAGGPVTTGGGGPRPGEPLPVLTEEQSAELAANKAFAAAIETAEAIGGQLAAKRSRR